MSEQTKLDWSALRALKTEPNGRCFQSLGTDGVVRIWHFDTWEVIDAVGLSPAHIKEWLERKPFDQAKEEKFRGVDGRRVSRADMLNPSQENIPERPSPEFVKEHYDTVEERKRKGSPRDPNALACNAKMSTYNLDPV